MSYLRWGVFLIALLAVTPRTAADGPAEEARRLAGKWVGAAGVWSGNALSAEQARQCILILLPPRPGTDLSGGPRGLDLFVPDKLVGYDISTSSGKETRYITEWRDYACSLDPSPDPPVLKTFKIVGLKGHGFGGIYRTTGDTLTVCVRFDQLAPLPKKFASPRGSEILLLTLRRGK